MVDGAARTMAYTAHLKADQAWRKGAFLVLDMVQIPLERILGKGGVAVPVS